MERGPLALFGAIIAVGLGPAMWLGAQFGQAGAVPSTPPAITVQQDQGRGGVGGAATEGPTDVIETKPKSNVEPLVTARPKPHKSSAEPSPSASASPSESTPTASPSPSTGEPTPSTEPTTEPSTGPSTGASDPAVPPTSPTSSGNGAIYDVSAVV